MELIEEFVVEEKHLAENVGSGDVPVLATPVLLTVCEKVAKELAKRMIKENETTVGTYAEIKHLKATPKGFKVRAKAEVAESDGRKIRFNISAFDEVEKVFEGIHERAIVEKIKFLEKIKNKKI